MQGFAGWTEGAAILSPSAGGCKRGRGGVTFDRIIVVDWSARSRPSPPRPVADAIWTCAAGEVTGEEPAYHRTRAAAEAALGEAVAAARAAGQRLLVGFDFPFGYPEGFAAIVTGQACAGALHGWLAAEITDRPDNGNDRFALAARLNGLTPAPGPFWGRPAGLDLPGLPARKPRDYAALGLAERRAVEQAIPRAQPVWKLYTTGSVGSQALLGLPVVHRLAARFGAAVWPFDDWQGAGVVLAEVYPSLLGRGLAARDPDGIADRVQVAALARAFARLARGPALARLLDAVPEGAPRREEGWILGAGAEAALQGAAWT